MTPLVPPFSVSRHYHVPLHASSPTMLKIVDAGDTLVALAPIDPEDDRFATHSRIRANQIASALTAAAERNNA